MRVLVAATNNVHKIHEMGALLGPFFQIKGLNDIGCTEELPETQSTIEGNSLQKAKFVFDHYHVDCFADDTGLEVESLNREPGVFSARYAGAHKNNDDNIALLLQNLKGAHNRKARFKTVITLVESDATTSFEGIIEGEIILERRGKMGFGYDSVFIPEGYDQTFAEMSLEQKNLISHRSIAVKKLINFIRQKYS